MSLPCLGNKIEYKTISKLELCEKCHSQKATKGCDCGGGWPRRRRNRNSYDESNEMVDHHYDYFSFGHVVVHVDHHWLIPSLVNIIEFSVFYYTATQHFRKWLLVNLRNNYLPLQDNHMLVELTLLPYSMG